jgi:hypothetical protein
LIIGVSIGKNNKKVSSMKKIMDNSKSKKRILRSFSRERLVRLVAFFALTFLIPIFSMNEEPVYVAGSCQNQQLLPLVEEFNALRKQNELLFFLDDSEKDEDTLGAIGGDLLIALYQEVGPIIASNALLYAVLNKRKEGRKSTIMLTAESVKEWHEHHTVDDTREDIIVSRIGFLPERWMIKKISNLLSLLLPYAYLESLNIDKNKVEESGHPLSITSDVELQLGFRVNHMETIHYDVFYFFQAPTRKYAHYLIDVLDIIFCKKTDYKDRKIDLPQWIIFINGHGSINDCVAYLSLDDFKKFLHFLENNIITQLLVVSSCCAGGVNMNAIYGEIKLGTQQLYTFPIIIQGLNDVSTDKVLPRIDIQAWDDEQKIQLATDIDYRNFFKEAKKLEGNYAKIIKPITVGKTESIPQIKLPGVEWFSVMEVKKSIVSLGSILVKTRDPQIPLDIVSFFKKDPKAILLYTDDIPFELVINSHNLKAIVSMLSGQKVFHTIKRISSMTQSFLEILKWFASSAVHKIGFDKWFFIDEISDNAGTLIKDIRIVVYGKADKNVKIYYKDDKDVLYMILPLVKGGLEPMVLENWFLDTAEYEVGMCMKEQYLALKAKKAQEETQEITPEQIEKIKSTLSKKPKEHEAQ